MPLMKCETNFILAWSSTCFITNSKDGGAFSIIVLIKQFTGKNINQKYQYKNKNNIFIT